MASAVQNTEQWSEAVQLFEKGQLMKSVQKFGKLANSSKIFFNIGVIFQLLERHKEAISEFTKAVKRDPYFSVAYFLRGISQHLLGELDDSVNSFCDALDHMRGNDEIDYTQLGFAYQLYACEIFYNCALSYSKLGNDETALELLQNAASIKQLPEHDVIDKAMRARCRGFDLFQLPPDLIFKPPVSKVEGIKKIDFLGSAKVIAAIKPDDNFIEFKGYRALELKNAVSPEPSSAKPRTRNFRIRSKTPPRPRRPSGESVFSYGNPTLRTSNLSERSSSLSPSPRRTSNESNSSGENRPPRPPRPFLL